MTVVARLALDPGDRHVGWADQKRTSDGGWGTRAGEIDNTAALTFVASWIGSHQRQGPVEVVVEDFVLYPGQDKRKSWNPMATSELIGGIELLCAQTQVSCVRQPASIKKPTKRQLRARGIQLRGVGPHARDAETHLWYRTLRSENATAT